MSPRAGFAAHWRADIAPSSAAGFTGLQAWYDASQITGVSDGAALSSWPDKSGNGRNLAQATGSLQPLYRSSSSVVTLPNGKPVVQWDGVNDAMSSASVSIAAQPFTLAVVWKNLVSDGAQHTAIGNNSATPAVVYLDSGGVKGYCGNTLGAGLAVDTVAHTFIFVGNGSSSLWRVDGNADVTGNAGTNGLTSGLMIGRDQAGPTSPWNGWFAEIAIYNRVLTPTERTQLAGLLKTKYGTP